MTVAENAAAESDRIDAAVWRVSLVVLVGTVMSILDTTIVNVALATLSRDLHATISSVQWVVTGYMLALGSAIPVSGWAGRRFGAKQVYLASVVLFTVGSALCGLATSTTELILFRGIQGVGGGGLIAMAQAIIGDIVSPRERGKYQGYLGAVFTTRLSSMGMNRPNTIAARTHHLRRSEPVAACGEGVRSARAMSGSFRSDDERRRF